MLSYIKPDEKLAHEFIVKEVVDKQKTFNTKEGAKKKYVIYFSNDYAAEYCPLIGSDWDERIAPGKKLMFRIVYRKDFGDEILPYNLPSGEQSVSKQIGKIVSISGHPAVFALKSAVDFTIARMNCIGVEKSEIQITDVIENADFFYDWLINKADNP